MDKVSIVKKATDLLNKTAEKSIFKTKVEIDTSLLDRLAAGAKVSTKEVKFKNTKEDITWEVYLIKKEDRLGVRFIIPDQEIKITYTLKGEDKVYNLKLKNVEIELDRDREREDINVYPEFLNLEIEKEPVLFFKTA